MSENTTVTDEQKIAAVKNEWSKVFTLGEGDNQRTFEIKDLPYFDYIEFMQLARPIIKVAAGGLSLDNEGGEIKADFNPVNIDLDEVIGICGKELPKLGWLICKQSDPKIKQEEVALLARRPQRLIELVLMQIGHNKMIEEFGAFFQRLTAMVTIMMPDIAQAANPSALQTESTTEETHSS